MNHTTGLVFNDLPLQPTKLIDDELVAMIEQPLVLIFTIKTVAAFARFYWAFVAVMIDFLRL